ncbi:MAG: proteasome subunit alpha [Candidatus Hodarchaeota archaeon]
MPEIRVVVSEELDRYMSTVVQKGMFGSKAELIRAALIRYFETLPIRVPSGYDDTTMFSPDGRIFQLEYALEGAQRGAIIVGLHYRDGVMLAKERRYLGHFPKGGTIISSPWEGYKIDEHIGTVPTGMGSDFILLKDKATKEAQIYREQNGEPISVEELVKRLSIFMQSYTMKKDVRPLGCILLVGGVDQTGQRLFSLDPSGFYSEVVYNVVGYQSAETEETLEKNHKSSMTLQQALSLIIKAVLKEETRKPEEIAVAIVEAKTKALREITLEEVRNAWKTVFKKKID